MYKLLYSSIRVRTVPPVSVRVRVSVSFSSTFCAMKLITSNECIAQGAPSFELVRRHKYSERAIVTARRNNIIFLNLPQANSPCKKCQLVHYR